ncbi:MAG TPA: glycosyltransferase [Chroococcales cyanobacterium]|jgi:glycosyltransferase involved in cell wall biosynthesis
MNERVTWLLPVKNGMPYLPETLASIEAQTYPNWEVLAWDNGSTDGTVEELHKWIPSRLPGRVITGQPLGLGGCRAAMVEQCETEFCAIIDADDINVPERLEKQVAFLLAHPDVAVVGSKMYCVDRHGVKQGLFHWLPLEHDDIVHFMLHSNGIAQPSVLFRRSAVLQAGNYREMGPDNVEDYDLWLRVAIYHKLANLDVPLVYYRIHDKSTTQMTIAQNRLAQVTDERFCKNAPLLYGCSESDARLLRQKKHPYALFVLFQIARHLQRTQNGRLIDRLTSKSFLRACKNLMLSRT